MDWRTALTAEYHRRRRRNPRYSLRAFAQSLDTHHTTLARVMRGQRRVMSRTAWRIGRKLGLSEDDIRSATRHQHATAILALVARSDFRPDARWIATMAGISIDQVAVALHHLMHTRQLKLTGQRRWSIEEP